MKTLTLLATLLLGYSVNGQVKTTVSTSTNGSRSATLSLELTKPSTTITSQVNFEYPNGTNPEPLAYKKGANKRTYIVVANESFTDMSKFEIDIFYGNKTLSKGTLLVWLSAKSAGTQKMSPGTYRFSKKSVSERKEYEFSGTVKLGSTDVPIADGWFTVNTSDRIINISYRLTLENGVKTNGQYNLPYRQEDRSKLAVR